MKKLQLDETFLLETKSEKVNLKTNSFESSFDKILNQKLEPKTNSDFKSWSIFGLQILAYLSLLIAGQKLVSLGGDFLLLFFIPTAFYTVTSLLLFIVLSDKKILWLSLVLQMIIAILYSVFLGQGSSFVVIFGSLFNLFFGYVGYLDLEKHQLSSRIFTLGGIARDTNKTLTIISIITLTIILYSSIAGLGSKVFIQNYLLNSNSKVEELVVKTGINKLLNSSGLGPNPFDNYSYLDQKVIEQNDKKEKIPLLFRSFLKSSYLYQKSKESLKSLEGSECLAKISLNPIDCKYKLAINDEILLEYRNFKYPSYSIELASELTKNDILALNRDYIADLLANFETVEIKPARGTENAITDVLNKIAVLVKQMQSSFLPAIISVLVFILFYIIKQIAIWINFLLLYIVWNILLYFKFVKIQTETCEAEIISL
jgi:hypothetical protein